MLPLNIFKAFISGSSLIVVFPFLSGFKSLEHDFNLSPHSRFLDTYYMYTLICPLYLGIVSVIAYLISYYTKIKLEISFLLISIIAVLFTTSINTYKKTYNFTQKKWYQYYIVLFLYYIIIFNVIIVNILKLLL